MVGYVARNCNSAQNRNSGWALQAVESLVLAKPVGDESGAFETVGEALQRSFLSLSLSLYLAFNIFLSLTLSLSLYIYAYI